MKPENAVGPRPRVRGAAPETEPYTTQDSIPAIADVHTFTDEWCDVADRYCSGAYHDPEAAREEIARAGLTEGCFPTRDHLILAEILVAHAGLGLPPTVASVREVARQAGYLSNTGDDFDLIADLPLLECSAAGRASYAALLVDFARRRALFDALRRYEAMALDLFTRLDEVGAEILTFLDSWTKQGEELAKPPRRTRPPEIITSERVYRRRTRRVSL